MILQNIMSYPITIHMHEEPPPLKLRFHFILEMREKKVNQIRVKSLIKRLLVVISNNAF